MQDYYISLRPDITQLKNSISYAVEPETTNLLVQSTNQNVKLEGTYQSFAGGLKSFKIPVFKSEKEVFNYNYDIDLNDEPITFSIYCKQEKPVDMNVYVTVDGIEYTVLSTQCDDSWNRYYGTLKLTGKLDNVRMTVNSNDVQYFYYTMPQLEKHFFPTTFTLNYRPQTKFLIPLEYMRKHLYDNIDDDVRNKQIGFFMYTPQFHTEEFQNQEYIDILSTNEGDIKPGSISLRINSNHELELVVQKTELNEGSFDYRVYNHGQIEQETWHFYLLNVKNIDEYADVEFYIDGQLSVQNYELKNKQSAESALQDGFIFSSKRSILISNVILLDSTNTDMQQIQSKLSSSTVQLQTPQYLKQIPVIV